MAHKTRVRVIQTYYWARTSKPGQKQANKHHVNDSFFQISQIHQTCSRLKVEKGGGGLEHISREIKRSFLNSRKMK